MTLRSFIKGFLGEAVVTVGKKLFLDSKIYIDVNNVTLATGNGTTQIDHIIVSRYGIFVVETKNMDGWIFGDEKSSRWTQSVFGRKYQFQNPLHQNYRHSKTLAEFLGVDHAKLFSIVFFIGDAEFKTPMPENVLLSGYGTYVKSKTAILFSDDEVQSMVAAIRGGKALNRLGTRQAHVAGLRERYSSTTTCPKCSSGLVLRTAKTGKNAGGQFYGCSAYPKCRYTAPAAAKA